MKGMRCRGLAPLGMDFWVLPADGAVDQSRAPTLEWAAAAQASTYDVEVSTDPGFGIIVYAATTAQTTHPLSTSLDPLTVHYWRVRANNSCGSGGDSAVSSFTTLDIPAILVVDDDDNSPDVRASYTAALAALGQDFDVWALEQYGDALHYTGTVDGLEILNGNGE